MSQVSEIFSARCDFDHFRVSFSRPQHEAGMLDRTAPDKRLQRDCLKIGEVSGHLSLMP